jgi:hypothetical protein
MPDMEKVIKGLEYCFATANCDGCPYEIECRKIPLKTPENHCPILDDILVLLKEQETEDTGRCRIFQCKKCGFGIDDIFVTDEERYQIVPRYCPNCGRSVV